MYNLQCLRRAKFVGETTGGAANPAYSHDTDDWFHFAVPFGRPINPITKTNWEGGGVVPDIPIPTSESLEEGLRSAIQDVLGFRRQSEV